MASRISLPEIFVAAGFSFLPGLGCCWGQVLGVEVYFDLLGQLQPGLILRVGIGVHEDGCGWTFWFYGVVAGYPMQTVMRFSRCGI